MIITVKQGTNYYRMNICHELEFYGKIKETEDIIYDLYDSVLDAYLVRIYNEERDDFELFWIKEKDVEVI